MIAVIGASSSGLFAAWLLAQEEVGVEVFERNPQGEISSRRLIVTSALLKLVDLPDDLALYRVRGYELLADGSRAFIPLKVPDIVIERRDLILSLLRRAEGAGVKVHWGWDFAGLGEGGRLVRLRGPGGELLLTPSRLIAADGAQSAVRRALRLPLPLVFILQAKVVLSPDHPQGLARIWFRPELTPYFFWLFPDSDSTGVLGVIAEGRDQAEAALQRVFGAEEVLGYEEGVVSLYDPHLPAELGRVLFVGDAAGHVKVTTVGGTVTGLRGAKACAQAILKGTPYQRRLAPLRRELKIHLWLRKLLNRMDLDGYRRLLRAASDGTSLGRFPRDHLARHLPLLPLRAPLFSLRLMRALFGS